MRRNFTRDKNYISHTELANKNLENLFSTSSNVCIDMVRPDVYAPQKVTIEYVNITTYRTK